MNVILIATLVRATCQRERQALVVIGRPAVAPLMEALENPSDDVWWEAAMALDEIGDPVARWH